MDATEFGAYMSLIITCYQTNNILPNNDSRLARMARTSPKVWKRIRPIVAEKFTISDSQWSHEGVRSDLEKYSSLSTKNRANRLKGNKKRSPVVNVSSDQSATNTNNNNQITINYNKKDFDDFFQAYPKQVDPYEAEQAFMQQIEEGEDPGQIIEAAKQYAAEQDGNEKKFIKSPVTFLDKKVFQSPEYNKAPPKPVDMSKHPEWMQTLAQRIGVAAVISWFADTQKDGSTLIVARRFAQDWIRNHYQKEIEAIGIKDVKFVQPKQEKK